MRKMYRWDVTFEVEEGLNRTINIITRNRDIWEVVYVLEKTENKLKEEKLHKRIESIEFKGETYTQLSDKKDKEGDYFG